MNFWKDASLVERLSAVAELLTEYGDYDQSRSVSEALEMIEYPAYVVVPIDSLDMAGPSLERLAELRGRAARGVAVSTDASANDLLARADALPRETE